MNKICNFNHLKYYAYLISLYVQHKVIILKLELQPTSIWIGQDERIEHNDVVQITILIFYSLTASWTCSCSCWIRSWSRRAKDSESVGGKGSDASWHSWFFSCPGSLESPFCVLLRAIVFATLISRCRKNMTCFWILNTIWILKSFWSMKSKSMTYFLSDYRSKIYSGFCSCLCFCSNFYFGFYSDFGCCFSYHSRL